MVMLTADDIQNTLAVAGVTSVAVASVIENKQSFSFATASEEAHFIATASDDDVIAYASSIALAEDGKPNEESAAKFAKNRGFLSGLMKKIWNKLKGAKSVFQVLGVAAAITLVGTSLLLAAKNPAKFGAISKEFAAKASEWCGRVGQFAAKAINTASKNAGSVKSFLLKRAEHAVTLLKSLPALLNSAASKGAQMAKEASNAGLRRAGGAIHRAGNAAQQGVRKAGNATFKAGEELVERGAGRAGDVAHKLSGQIHKRGGQLAAGIKQVGTKTAMQGIPG